MADRHTRLTEFKVQVFGAVFLGKPTNLEDGDKVVLHTTVLDGLMSKYGNGQHSTLPHPIIFEISNVEYGRVSHCGVLEFSAPRNACFMPKWMMDHLLLEDGKWVNLRLRELPKANKATFQALKWSFGQLPNPKNTLEFALRKFTALTQGDTILIRHMGTDHYLNVIKVAPSTTRPQPAVCVIDTAIAVEFETPLEAPPAEEKFIDLEINEPMDGTVTANNYSYYRVRLVDPHMALRITCTPKTGDPDIYVHNKTITRPTVDVHLWRAQKSTGDREYLDIDPAHPQFAEGVYHIGIHGYKAPATFTLLVTEELPERDRKKEEAKKESKGNVVGRLGDPVTSPSRPTTPSTTTSPAKVASPAKHASPSAGRGIAFTTGSGNTTGGTTAVGSRPASAAATGSPATRIQSPAAGGMSGGHGTAASPIAVALSPRSAAARGIPPPTPAAEPKKCDNCDSMVPGGQRYDIHVATCKRNNWRCGECKKVMRASESKTHVHCPKCHIGLHKDELDKHIDVQHRATECPDCKQKMEPDLLDHHRKTACNMRAEKCMFCHVTFPLRDLEEHQRYCGGKSVPCEICGKEVPRKKLQIHMAVEHKINPSLAPGGSAAHAKQAGFATPPAGGAGGARRTGPPAGFVSRAVPAGREVIMPSPTARPRSPAAGPRPTSSAAERELEEIMQLSRAAQMSEDEAILARVLAESAGTPATPSGEHKATSAASTTPTTPSTLSTPTRAATPTAAPTRSSPAASPTMAPVKRPAASPPPISMRCDHCGTSVAGSYENLMDHYAVCERFT